MSELRLAAVQTLGAVVTAVDAAPARTQVHDRLADAYHGVLGQKLMRETQQRVHWVCAQTKGEQVLDVGCSQGITSILLAREGKTVTGVDVDAEVIHQARQLQSLESAQVQARLSFITADAAVHPFGVKRFDTVVMSEVLERLNDPGRLLKIAADCLAPGQPLVVTLPFGIDEAADHKRPFYLLEPLELLSTFFDIADVAVLGKWLGVVAKRSNPRRARKLASDIPADLLRKIEAGFCAVERSIKDDLSATHQQLDDANRRHRDSTEQVAGLKKRLVQEEFARRANEQEVAGLIDRHQQAERACSSSDALLQAQQAETRQAHEQGGALRREVSELLGQLESVDARYRVVSEQVGGLGQQLQLAQAERVACEARIAELQAVARLDDLRLQQAIERGAELRARVEHLEGARRSAELDAQQGRVQLALAEQLVSQGRVRIADIEARAAFEQSTQLQKLGELQQLAKTQGTLVQDAELQAVRMAGELAAVKQRLDDANLKYRASTERVAQLKQTVGEAQAACNAASTQATQADTIRRQAEQALEAARTAHQQETDERTAQLVGAQADAAMARQQLNELRQELTAELGAVLADRDALLPRLRQADAERDSAFAAIETSRAAIATLERAATEREAALWELRQAAEREIAQLAPDLEAANAAAAHAEALQRQAEQALRTAAAAHNREMARQTATLRLTQTEAAASIQQLEGLEKQLRGELTTAVAERDSLWPRLHQVDAELNDAILVIDESRRAISVLNETAVQRDADRAQAIQSARDAESEGVRLQALLVDADASFRAVEGRVGELQAQLDAERETRDRAHEAEVEAKQLLMALHSDVERLQSLHTQKDDARRDALDSAARLAGELESLRAVHLGRGQDVERLKVEAVRQRLALGDANAHTERLRQQLRAAQEQVKTARATLAFQLGHALIFGFKSFSGFKNLPGKLWTIRRQATQRRAAKAAMISPAAAVASLRIGSPGAVPPTPPLLAPPAPDKRPPQAMSGFQGADSAAGLSAMLKSLKVAAIMDEFTHGSFHDECNLLQLTPSHWMSELEGFQPELLFIESAWRGKDDLWGNKVGHMSSEIVAIVKWCREHQVATMFWNKEDPVHFTTFLSTAKLFDHVFTTDIDCIGPYKAALGHERVYLLPFAAQPTMSNPVESYERKDAFCFAGAYYAQYPERTHDLGNFLATMPAFKPVEIYDRNFGKNDSNYKFPDEYQPFIVGNLPFDQIDRAYKGYRFGINLNSIKQSQSMFARRVFELLASNTVTVSNFSRGVRLLFGDLVLTSDSGDSLVKRVRELAGDEVGLRKFRLAALRKVMSEHTYQDRLAYAVSKVRGTDPGRLLPRIVVTACAKNQFQVDALMANFRRQVYPDKSLMLVVPGGFEPQAWAAERVSLVVAGTTRHMCLGDLGEPDDWLAVMVPDDFYGPNYLLDLAVATRYAKSPVVGKVSHYGWSAAGLRLEQDGRQYRRVVAVAARAGAARLEHVRALGFREWIGSLYTCQFEHEAALAIDEFNYCKNAAAEGFSDAERAMVNDATHLDTGMALERLTSWAESIAPQVQDRSDVPQISGIALAALFRQVPANTQVTVAADGVALQIDSSLPDGKHEYWYASQDHTPDALGAKLAKIRVHLQATPGLNLQLVLLFLDAARQRITHVIVASNLNHEIDLPLATAHVRIGLRIYAGGAAKVFALLLGHRDHRPPELLTRSEHLLLTNHYPSHDDLYRNAFVHRRVAAYRQRGVKVDVFRLRAGETLAYHEFDDVDCVSGSSAVLHRALASGRHKTVLVHFLDEATWEILRHHVDRVKVIVWVHGAEMQPFHRREYNYVTEDERVNGRLQSDKRTAFWRGILKQMPANLQLVFVSNQFAQEAMQDLGVRLPEGAWSVIHNPIDTDLFGYRPKPPEQRKKILSIRPYSSRTYANDLSVKAIIDLSTKPFFRDLEFRLIGDGPLFDVTLAPLRGFDNVIIERRFLSQGDIAEMHKSYGMFLCPSRMDSQGVSRDEAMASGLVPITNAVAAIPEFVDDSCGILAPAEDALALAAGIERLVKDPDAFQRMSAAASQRVRKQSASGAVVTAELALISA